MGFVFYECSSLKILPDISKWNIENVTLIAGLFFGCSSLKELPDISYWNISKVEFLGFFLENVNH